MGSRQGRDHPRTRGEYPSVMVCHFFCAGSPPHTRGIPRSCQSDSRRTRITPAHAGNTQPVPCPCHCDRDHPRTRGEYSIPISDMTKAQGSPPHTRGILAIFQIYRCFFGITPAHAGNTLFYSFCKLKYWDHPRTRGEYFVYNLIVSYCGGSPPHTRGILVWLNTTLP